MHKVRFSELFDFQKKSSRKSGDGLIIGKYPFFTSSSQLSKFTNTPDYKLDNALIFGSGGSASVHHVTDSFSTSADCFVVTKKVNIEILLKFAYYYLSGNIHILEEGFKGAGLKHISKAYIQEIKMPLPPLAEQQRIVAILDAADSLRQKDQQLVERYTSLSQSLFLEMFGDPLSNPKKWKLSTLSSLVKAVIDCPHTTPRWTESGKVAIRTSNLTVGGWIWDDKRYVTEQEYHERSARAYVKPGDIVLSREGTVGVAAIVNPDMEICLGQRLVQIQPNLQLANNHFLLNLILYELAPERIERVMVGATSKHLNLKDLRCMKMITPPIKLQNQFAERIQLIEVQKQQAQRSLEKSEALFNSLLQRAFTGELTAKMAA